MSNAIDMAEALVISKTALIDKTLAVRLIGDAWITFVTKTLTTAETLGHPDIAQELTRLEESGELAVLRSKRGVEARQILSDLLNCPARSRKQLCQQAEITLLALALDQVQLSTFKFVETGRPDREPPVDTILPLLEFFRQMLLNDDQIAMTSKNLVQQC